MQMTFCTCSLRAEAGRSIYLKALTMKHGTDLELFCSLSVGRLRKKILDGE